MLHNTNLPGFPARLKDEHEQLLAEGHAAVSQSERTVTFRGEFVPLYPIGTPMQVARTHGGREIHRFTGKVYLSDKHLMRLVSVEDTLLPGAEEVYTSGFELRAAVTAPGAPRAGLLGRLFPGPGEQRCGATVTALSPNAAELRLDRALPMEEGQLLRLALTPPPELPELTVRIVTSIQFGAAPSCQCAFTDLGAEDEARLRAFLWRRVQAECKLF